MVMKAICYMTQRWGGDIMEKNPIILVFVTISTILDIYYRRIVLVCLF